MSLPDQVAIRCDICGDTVYVKEDDDADRSRQGYPEPLWPFEWGTVTVRKRRSAETVLAMDACTTCMKKVPDAIRKVDEPRAKPLDDRSENFDLAQVGQAVEQVLIHNSNPYKYAAAAKDIIDRGQALLKELASYGYGVFKLPSKGSE